MKNKVDKKKPIRELSVLCNKYFGKDYEHWNWIVDEEWVGNHFATKYGIAIELPKKTKEGKSKYTDPFIVYGAGTTKGLIECANKALEYMYREFEGIKYDYSNPFKPQYY